MAINESSIKLPEAFKDFLKRFRNNRIKVESDVDPLPYRELVLLIVKYFKENNDRYLELVNMEAKK